MKASVPDRMGVFQPHRDGTEASLVHAIDPAERAPKTAKVELTAIR